MKVTMQTNELINHNIDTWNSATLHHAIKTSFENYELENLNLAVNSDQIINLLSQLPSIDTFKFLNFIDSKIPGMSFHFIMECVLLVSTSSYFWPKKLLFNFRASYYMACFPEKNMLGPTRIRLCNNLLFAEVTENFFIDFQQKRHDVDKRQFIAKEDRKKIKKDLYIQHFQEYIQKFTLDCLEEEDYYE